MKTLIILSVLMTAFTICRAQDLKENKIDEFTKKAVKRTSYETIVLKSDMTAYVRVSKIDSTMLLDLKLNLHGSVFSMKEKDQLMIKLDNDSIVTLSNLKYAVTCTGCGAKGFNGSGAQGIESSFYLQQVNQEALAHHSILKIRVYTSNGYSEEDVPAKNAEIIKKELLLVQ